MTLNGDVIQSHPQYLYDRCYFNLCVCYRIDFFCKFSSSYDEEFVINNVAVMHDFVPQGHVTLPVTFSIFSATMTARTMIFFLFLSFVVVREVNGIRIRCVAFAFDLVRQGHVAVQLTFPIIGTMRAMSVRLLCVIPNFSKFSFHLFELWKTNNNHCLPCI